MPRLRAVMAGKRETLLIIEVEIKRRPLSLANTQV